jgi:transposase-like protein
MARRGRKPIGTNLVERLDGSERAKARLKAILETLSGVRSIPEVCEDLGINESMFHRVRGEVLQTALERLEPRPLGRPPSTRSAGAPPPPEELRLAQMEEENLRLQVELKAAEVRRELADKLPRLAKSQNTNPAPEPGKKTTAQERKRLRKRLQRNRNRAKP